MADPGRLEQVFINLLINARDAIESKYQKIQESGSEEEKARYKKRIFLKTMSDKERVLIEVGDTGTGIPRAVADKIFEPFFTTKEVGKGTGLGLSISYGIVKDFRGEIRAISNRYEGACFLLEFPAEGGNEK
jgi:histidine kinase